MANENIIEKLQIKIDEIDRKVNLYGRQNISEVKVARLLKKKEQYELQIASLQ